MARLDDVFLIEHGCDLALNQMTATNNPDDIPFISRTEKNNGISDYVLYEPNIQIKPRHSLTVALGGTVLETFYQEREFYTGYHIAVLIPKQEMTKEQLLFYALCISQNRFKYSFGRQANKTLKDLVIPDLTEIPTYINNRIVKDVSLLNADIIRQDVSKWEPIKLKELFKITRGSCEAINEISIENGHNKIVSSSEFNNGVNNYTDRPTTYKSGTITVAINGSIGSCFYQETDYLATNDVAVMTPMYREINKNVALFLISMMTPAIKMKYSYGRKCTSSALEELSILLPTKNNKIDFEYIDKYIDSIESQFVL